MYSQESIESLKKSLRAGAPKSGPRYVYVFPVSVCNLECNFCPQFAVTEDDAQDKGLEPFYEVGNKLPDDVLLRALDEIFDLGPVKEVLFVGGEPLLHKSLDRFIARVKERSKETFTAVFTGGVLLGRWNERLLKSGVDMISVSINAATEETFLKVNPKKKPGTFGEIVRAIGELNELRSGGGPALRLSTVITKDTVLEAREFARFAKEKRASIVSFMPLMRYSNEKNEGAFDHLIPSEADFAEFSSEVASLRADAERAGLCIEVPGTASKTGCLDTAAYYSKSPCLVGYAVTLIGADGGVYPCCSARKSIGNLHEKSFTEIWRGPAYNGFRDEALLLPTGHKIDDVWCHECQDYEINSRLNDLLH
ncbi:MAG: radical SAM protein [Planctomycetes bacterium]|nr:radical SAM protein [Planctomycetota bacterium]